MELILSATSYLWLWLTWKSFFSRGGWSLAGCATMGYSVSIRKTLCESCAGILCCIWWDCFGKFGCSVPEWRPDSRGEEQIFTFDSKENVTRMNGLYFFLWLLKQCPLILIPLMFQFIYSIFILDREAPLLGTFE